MYAKYTGFFRTRRENHNLIKFSPFWKRNYLIKFSPFWKRNYLIKFSPFWGDLIFKHPNGCFFVGFLFRATRFTSFRAKIRGPRGKLCTRGEKAHTSKRVSIIACNNVILKVQCAPHRPEGQQYKTKRFYIKSVLFRFAFRNGYA